eukprot:13997241-Alexandrium_andersonii.AAC.1
MAGKRGAFRNGWAVVGRVFRSPSLPCLPSPPCPLACACALGLRGEVASPSRPSMGGRRALPPMSGGTEGRPPTTRPTE